MGKRLEDLKLDDPPIPATPAPRPAVPHARDHDAVRLCMEEIADLRSSGEADWAERTLSGIYATVLETWRVTEGQQRAVRNIAAAVERRLAERGGTRPGYSRRYEGWQR